MNFKPSFSEGNMPVVDMTFIHPNRADAAVMLRSVAFRLGLYSSSMSH